MDAVLLPDKIKSYVLDEIAKGIEPWPVNSNRASEIGHPCPRYLALHRMFWKEEEKHTVELQSIFDEGKFQHLEFSRWLSNHGVTVIMEECNFSEKKFQLNGKIDGMCKFPFMDKAMPYEFKSMSNYAWQKVNTWEDIKNSDYLYTRNYAIQFNIYLYLTEKEVGLFFIKNKEKGIASLKTLVVTLDYEMAEQTLKKCDIVNEAITRFETVDREMGREAAMLSLPPYLLETDVCSRCGQRVKCCPPLPRVETDIVTSEETVESFKRFMELKPVIEEYNALQKELKSTLEGKNLMIDRWMVTGKWIEVKGRTQEVKPYKFWKQIYSMIEDKKGTVVPNE